MTKWTDETWNPVRGCSLVSAGCTHCYAMRQAWRFNGEGQPYEGLTKKAARGPVWTGEARFIPEQLEKPLRWRKPRRVFVNSMSDLFHPDITNEQIAAVFGVMAASPQHTFQILTKRPERARQWFAWAQRLDSPGSERAWRVCRVQMLYCVEPPRDGYGPQTRETWPLPNVWLGVSVEDQATADDRIPQLLRLPAAIRFVSAEPLLGPIYFGDDIYAAMSGESSPPIDWVIVGGEFGPNARLCYVDWVRRIVRACHFSGIAVFVKQLGYRYEDPVTGVAGVGVELPAEYPKLRQRFKDRKGSDPDEWPEYLRVREWPKEDMQ